MSAPLVVDRDQQPDRTPTPPRPVTGLALVGLALAVIGTASTVVVGRALRSYNHDGPVSTAILVVLVVISLLPWWPAFRAFGGARERARLLRDNQLVAARRVSARGREDAQIAMGYAAGVIIVAGVLGVVLANSGGIAGTFFASDPIGQSFGEVVRAFWTNIWVAVVAQVLVLFFGLLVAIVRMLPGRAGAPLRLIALVYCDVFRAIPAIVVILLVGFGMPLTKFPLLSSLSPVWLGVIALTLTYSAYVSEVYRAGLSSIHPSQSAAARSLGLSYGQTLRTVLVPQAIRRVVPPLLNDFISLQKDTALLSVISVAEALLTSKLWESHLFNLSPIVLTAGLFILITIPQARFVDFLIDRDASRRAGGN
jgi:polar amino acid transport system permease protein